MRSKGLWNAIAPIVVVAILLWIWQTTTNEFTGADALAFPSPSAVGAVFTDHWRTLLDASLLTSLRVVAGAGIGASVGVALGLACARFPLLFATLNPIIEVIRPIPPIALTPFFILWFGLGTEGQILLIAMGSFMIVFVTISGAIKNLDVIYERALFAMGGSRSDLPLAVWLPASLPEVGNSLRVAIATAFALTIAAEYLGAQGGLGFIIRNARTTLDTPSVLAAALLLGLLSYFVDLAVRAVVLRMTDWVPRSGDTKNDHAS